jgi:hypothetical protein
LRGYFAGGHFLSAVALAYAGSANTDLKAEETELTSVQGREDVDSHPLEPILRVRRRQRKGKPL